MTPDAEHDVLAADLAGLGPALPGPTAVADLVAGVMARLSDVPAPVRASRGRRLLGLAVAAVAHRRRRAAVLVTAVLLALLAASPVRAAVAEWFGFAGVLVREDTTSRPSLAPLPPTVGPSTALDDAQQQVAFDVVVPAVLGPPDGVEVSEDRRVLSMSWTGAGDGVVRLDQFDGRLDYAFAKSARGVEFTTVAGAFALWFDEPHEVVVLDADGTSRTETARLAGHTLIWEHGGTALRLEGSVSQARATEIAESVAVVP